ncbi:MAG: hypothetical protein IJ438_03130 [Clostridia bacterium]|nr:hypothetical protein [Clostridia bacterium]
MNTKASHTKQILDAIHHGGLPPAQTEARLLGIIQEESERTDREADMVLVNACLDLLEQLHSASAAGRPARQPKLRRLARLRPAAALAAALVLVVIGGLMLRTPQEQPQAVLGPSLDMIATAMAEGNPTETIIVEDISQLDSLLGLQLQLPAQLCGEWTATQGQIRYLPEYIRIEFAYAHAASPEKDIVCVISLFTETDNLYISSEQTGEGGTVHANGRSIYISAVSGDLPANDRIAAYWQEQGVSMRLSGRITASEAVRLMLALAESQDAN